MCTTPLEKRRRTSSDTTVIPCQPITDAVVSGSCVSDGYLLKSVKALLDDKAFLMPSASATTALKMAQDLMKWMPSNDVKVKAFQNDIVELLRGCIKPIKLLTSMNRGGLIVVNNMAFELFHTMECEFAQYPTNRDS
ncbi:hypothetical protein EMCRGX_G007199 [Ephydatia muelleri]